MAIAKLKKLNIFFLRKETDNILSFLQNLRKVEIFDVKENKKKSFESKINRDNESIIIDINEGMDKQQNENIVNFKAVLISKLEKSINILERYEKSKSFLDKLNSGIILKKSEFEKVDNEKNNELIFICEEVNNLLKDLDKYRSKKIEILENIENIKPWFNLKSRLDGIFGTNYARTIAGILPIEKYESFLQEEIIGLEKSDRELLEIFEISRDEKQVYFLVITYFEIAKFVREHISKIGKVLHWESMEKTPSEFLEYLKKYLSALDRKEKNIIKALQKKSVYIKDLKILYDKTYNEWLKLRKNSSLYFGSNVGILGAWIKEKDIEAIQKDLEDKFPNTYAVIEEPDEDDEVPVAFENIGLVKPFEIITDLYGRPGYFGVDPTLFLSPFFLFFFGICLGDAGYGLIMIISAILFKFLLKEKDKNMKKSLNLLLFVGFSTLLVGLLTGTFFGNLVKFLPDSLNFVKEFLKRFVIIDTMNAKGSLMFLGFSLAFGYLQLCFGLILKIALMIRDKKYKDLILDGLSAFCMQISLLPISLYYILDFKFFPPFAMNIFLGMFLISVVLIAVKEWINNEGIMVKIFWCLYGNYSAITGTFLSDTLSYARLFALGLSGGLLGLAINEIASVFGAIPVIGIILMILVMIGGHIFNLGVSGLGSFVHSCRLQYLEFFTKFFEASGREMQPFCHENKYIEIEKN